MKKLTFLMMILGLIFASTGNVMAIADGTVEMFKNKNFEDGPMLLGVFSKDVMDDGWDNNISSIKVGKGVKVTLFNDPYQNREKPYIVLYPGEYKDLRMDYEGNPWNDKVSSVRVEKLDDPNLPLIKLTYGRSGGIFTQMIGLGGNDEFKKTESLLLNDDLISAEIPPEYKVTFYEDKEFGGHKNSEPVSGRTVYMSEFGLKDRVSSIKIEWNKYALTKVVMKKSETQPNPPGKVKLEPMGADTECDHRAATVGLYQCKKTLTSEYTATATTSWDNSTTVGITATTTVSAKAEVVGVGSAGVEQSLALSVANEFRIGKEESTTVTQTMSDEVNITLNPGEGIGFTMEVVPAAVTYDVSYIYTSVDDNGKPDGKGRERVVKGKMTINSASTSKAVSYDLEGSKSSQSTQPAADQGMMARAMEWIKERPCRLYEFFGGKDPAWMCGGANDKPNTNTSVQPSSPSTDTK